MNKTTLIFDLSNHIRRTFFFVVLLIFVQSSLNFLHSQRLGIKSDISLIRLYEPHHTQNNIRIGFSTGALVEFKLNNSFYVQTELLLSKKGCLLKDNNLDLDYRLYYIELPLKLKYRFIVKDDNIDAYLGPYLAYGISGRLYSDTFMDTSVKYFDLFKKTATGSDSAFSRFDLGVTLGIQYEFGNHFFISGEIKPGLRTIMYNKNLPLYNQLISIGVGYLFH